MPHPSSRRPADRRAEPPRSSQQASPTSRRIAYDVLTSYDNTRPEGPADRLGTPHVNQLLEDYLARKPAGVQERRLATELVYGVVRRRATLAAILAKFLARPRTNIEDGLWRLLELGAYQLVLLSGVPPHAAVSETVLLAKQIGKPQWSGFLNGVLRNIGRELLDGVTSELSRRGVPLSESADAADAVRYRPMACDLFPDPRAESAAYLAAAFSYPQWLTQNWLDRNGWDEALRRAAWFNSPGRITLRVNPLRTDREQSLSALKSQGLEAAPGDAPSSIRLAKPVRIEDLPGFASGWFSVQDESAQQVAPLLAPQPGERVLDLCAAPGGKATHLAELMHNQGQVVACDIHAIRITSIEQNRDRLGLDCIQTQLIGANGERVPDGPFDAALVDAPCSNTGVLGKRPDVRWRIGPQDLVELPELQSRLLQTAIDRVRPGGRIVYSTCSIEPAENELLVRQVLAAAPGVQLVREQQQRPGCPGDGGYQALLVHGVD